MAITVKENVRGYKTMNINLEDFGVIQPSLGRQRAMVISVLKDGSVNFNSRLMEKFPMREVEIKMDAEARRILINDEGNVIIKLNKNGRIKNYNIIQLLEKNKIKFPAYYVVNWKEEISMWLGELYYDNPNRGNSNKNKKQP